MLKWARILIIEDELLVAWSLRDVLSLIGCEVTGIAATVSEALILAENIKPDLALVDVRLAGQHDGIEGVVLLRRQFGLPIIFLTDEVDGEAAWRAAEVGPIWSGPCTLLSWSRQFAPQWRRMLTNITRPNGSGWLDRADDFRPRQRNGFSVRDRWRKRRSQDCN